MHSADLPFPTLSSDYGSASCPSSLSPPPWSQPRVRSLLRLFRLFLECHLLFFLQLLSVCFHFFCPSTTNFLISSCLETSVDCMFSGVSLYLATCYQPCFISPFLLSLKGHRGNGASSPLALCGARQQSCILWRGRALCSTQFTENLGMANWQPAFGPQVSCFRVLKDLWKRMS